MIPQPSADDLSREPSADYCTDQGQMSIFNHIINAWVRRAVAAEARVAWLESGNESERA